MCDGSLDGKSQGNKGARECKLNFTESDFGVACSDVKPLQYQGANWVHWRSNLVLRGLYLNHTRYVSFP
jgi:hypothetical protein